MESRRAWAECYGETIDVAVAASTAGEVSEEGGDAGGEEDDDSGDDASSSSSSAASWPLLGVLNSDSGGKDMPGAIATNFAEKELSNVEDALVKAQTANELTKLSHL